MTRLIRTLVAAGLVPLLVALAAGVAVWSWTDALPAEVAVHWDIHGDADGFASATSAAWMLLGTGALLAAVGVGLGLLSRHEPSLTRVVAATTSGTSAFVAALGAKTVGDQRGLGDAAAATLSGWAVPVALLAGVGIALVAAALAPRRVEESARGGFGDPTPAVPVEADERIVWTRSVATSGVSTALLVACLGLSVVIAVVAAQWAILAVTLVLGVAAATVFSVRVLVDRRGLTVRGAFGWPRLHTDLSEIAHVGVARVRPVRDFGGYGYRIAAFGPLRGSHGLVLRPGEAITIERTDGRRTFVVVDDAATGAGVLQSLVDQQAQPR